MYYVHIGHGHIPPPKPKGIDPNLLGDEDKKSRLDVYKVCTVVYYYSSGESDV
jgi:hypothetical protein